MLTTPLASYSAYLDGRCLSDAEVAALRQWIAADVDHAVEFVELAILHAAITDRLMLGRLLEDLTSHRRDTVVTPDMLAAAIREIEVNSPRVELPVEPLPELPPRQRGSLIPAVAAVVAFICLGGWMLWQSPNLTPPVAGPTGVELREPVVPPAPLPPPVVAQVAASFDAVWGNASVAKPSQKVRQGAEFSLKSGVVQFLMASGAAVVVEGPSRFTLTSEQAIELARGKAAVRIVEGTGAFVVRTPTIEVLDLGTEFGVETDQSGAGKVMVFNGAVELSDAADARTDQATATPQRLDSGFEAAVDPTRPAAAAAALQPVTNQRYFLRPDEVQVRLRALAGSAGDHRLAAHFERQRIRGLLAYQGFDLQSSGAELVLGLAPQGLTAIGAMQFAAGPLGGTGDAIDIQGGPAFIPLDTTPQGAFGRAGLVTEGGMIGRTGAEVWISWQSQRILADGESTGSAGLSLMFGDRSDSDEPIFIGRAHGAEAELCLQTSWGQAPPPNGKRVTQQIDFDRATADVQPRKVDDDVHTWYAKIEFGDGVDRASVWLDADPAELESTAPQGFLEVDGIEFDRVRLAVNRAQEVWRFSEFAMATTPQAFEQLQQVGQFTSDQ